MSENGEAERARIPVEDHGEYRKFEEALGRNDNQDPDVFVYGQCVDAFGEGKDGFRGGPLRRIAETHRAAAKFVDSDDPGATGQLLVEMQTLYRQAGFGEYRPEVEVPEGATESRKQELIREKMRVDYRDVPARVAKEYVIRPVLEIRAEVRDKTSELYELVQNNADRVEIRRTAYDLERARLRLDTAEVMVVENVRGGDIAGLEERQTRIVFEIGSAVDPDWVIKANNDYAELKRSAGSDSADVGPNELHDNFIDVRRDLNELQAQLEEAVRYGRADGVCKLNNEIRRARVEELRARRAIQVEVYDARIKEKLGEGGRWVRVKRIWDGEARRVWGEAGEIKLEKGEAVDRLKQQEGELAAQARKSLADRAGEIKNEFLVYVDMATMRRREAKDVLRGVYSKREAGRVAQVDKAARRERREARKRSEKMKKEQERIARKRMRAHERHLDRVTKENRRRVKESADALRGFYPDLADQLRAKDDDWTAFAEGYKLQVKVILETDFSDNKAFAEMNEALLGVVEVREGGGGRTHTERDRINNLEHNRGNLARAIEGLIDGEVSQAQVVEALGEARGFVERNGNQFRQDDPNYVNLRSLLRIGQEMVGGGLSYDDARRAMRRRERGGAPQRGGGRR